jgi:hypothetical protein
MENMVRAMSGSIPEPISGTFKNNNNILFTKQPSLEAFQNSFT